MDALDKKLNKETYHRVGGTAHPASNLDAGGVPGMYLLDWFAGQAIAGLMSPNLTDDEILSRKEAAGEAYLVAREMLRARGRVLEDIKEEAWAAANARTPKVANIQPAK